MSKNKKTWNKWIGKAGASGQRCTTSECAQAHWTKPGTGRSNVAENSNHQPLVVMIKADEDDENVVNNDFDGR